ncbi:MAG: hypothetical protein ABIJ86_04100 [Spirochaetota bacterium]
MDSGKKPLLVEICMGVNCTFLGAGNLLQTILSEKDLTPYCMVRELSCFKDRCEHAYKSPIVRIDKEYFENASPEVILDALYTRIDEIKRVES